MTDTHTHILPNMDDGAASVEISAEMLRSEKRQGVDTVVLTPHYYPEDESTAAFLARRAAAYRELCTYLAALPDGTELPALILGAEVAWIPGLADLDGLRELCFEGSGNLLLELPFLPWGEHLFSELEDLIYRSGLTPVIAHLDRYVSVCPPKTLRRLLAMELPVQLSSAFTERFRERRMGMKLLRNGMTPLLVTDCHNMNHRKPELEAAYRAVQQKFGAELCVALGNRSDALCSECKKKTGVENGT